MLGGKNIEEGFGIAYRVIQVCIKVSFDFTIGSNGLQRFL